jgi:hypothetical protein
MIVPFVLLNLRFQQRHSWLLYNDSISSVSGLTPLHFGTPLEF